MLAFVSETNQFGAAFDRDAEPLQAGDQQSFVLVLGKDLQEAIGR